MVINPEHSMSMKRFVSKMHEGKTWEERNCQCSAD